jgi:F0F1-type ATP synthase membrane subunit a
MDDLKSKALNAMTFGASSVLLPSTQKSNFENTETSTATIIVVVVFFLVYIFCALKSTYNLTHSGLQTFLFFIFGFVYMSIAYMYYGLAGYKISK